MIGKKWNQYIMNECDKRKSHTNSKLDMICISSDNVKQPVTKTCTPLHYTSLHFTQLHFTPHHCTSRHFTSPHSTFTQLQFAVAEVLELYSLLFCWKKKNLTLYLLLFRVTLELFLMKSLFGVLY